MMIQRVNNNNNNNSRYERALHRTMHSCMFAIKAQPFQLNPRGDKPACIPRGDSHMLAPSKIMTHGGERDLIFRILPFNCLVLFIIEINYDVHKSRAWVALPVHPVVCVSDQW